jgi:hypothetical protein
MNQNMNKERCLIMFVKYPERGRVKSRLSQYLDESMVVLLYRAFIYDLLENLSGGDYQFRIAYHPRERKDDFRKEFGNAFSYMLQTGKDLGKKMHNAFNKCFLDGFHYVVVIGSDSPDLPQQIIQEAFQALNKSDAVIGPSYDGGYYLIGFCRESFISGAFEGMAWGTDSVFGMTMRILKSAGIHVHVLPAWRDIDRPEDIAALVNDSEKNGFVRSRTISFLQDHSLTKYC